MRTGNRRRHWPYGTLASRDHCSNRNMLTSLTLGRRWRTPCDVVRKPNHLYYKTDQLLPFSTDQPVQNLSLVHITLRISPKACHHLKFHTRDITHNELWTIACDGRGKTGKAYALGESETPQGQHRIGSGRVILAVEDRRLHDNQLNRS